MPDIVVATPGRMIDHLRNSMSVGLDDLAVLILDEADRLLELGFSAEIRELVCLQHRGFLLYRAKVAVTSLCCLCDILTILLNNIVVLM